jgi:hypothetical protein
LDGGGIKVIAVFPDKSRALVKGQSESVNEAVTDTIDDLLEWDLVPPTVSREFEPLDHDESSFIEGSAVSFQEWKKGARQLNSFLPVGQRAFPYERLLSLAQRAAKMHPSNHLRLLQMAVLDVLIYNYDRHSGNILVDRQGKVWAIDHGLAFSSSVETFGSGGMSRVSLRYLQAETGGKIPKSILSDLRNLEEGDLRAALSPLPREQINATVNRWKTMVAEGRVNL